MPSHSHQVVKEFCNLCDWAYQVWLNHREMFDKNPRKVELQKSMGADALLRLHAISHEYTLLQIAKLHDRSVVAGEITLGIEYIIKYGGWAEPTLAKLTALSTDLNQFSANLRSLRNKILSHNDLAAILSNSLLGNFEEGEDVKYFEYLQEFANIVHDNIIGGTYPFDDLVKNDVVAFMKIIKP